LGLGHLICGVNSGGLHRDLSQSWAEQPDAADKYLVGKVEIMTQLILRIGKTTKKNGRRGDKQERKAKTVEGKGKYM